MRIACAAVLLSVVPASAWGQPQVVRMGDVTLRHETLILAPSVGATLKPGSLVDMSLGRFIPRESLRLACKAGPIVPFSQTVVTTLTGQETSSADRELAAQLAMSFRLGPVKAGGGGRMADAESDRSRQDSVYALMSILDGAQVIDGRVSWPDDWKASGPGKPADTRERLSQFLAVYGTHYVEKLVYGRTILIKATARGQSQQRREEFAAKLSAKLWAFKAKGKIEQDELRELASYNFDFLAQVTGGKSDRTEQQLITSIEELHAFLQKLRDGTYKIESVPVMADVRTLAGLTDDAEINRCLRGDMVFEDPQADTLRLEQKKALEALAGRLAALETPVVAARYLAKQDYMKPLTAGTDEALLDFSVREFDTHGAVTTGDDWKFTAPKSGLYFVTTSVVCKQVGGGIALCLFKAGGRVAYLNQMISPSDKDTTLGGSTVVQLREGETLDIRASAFGKPRQTVIGSSNATWVSIHYVGR